MSDVRVRRPGFAAQDGTVCPWDGWYQIVVDPLVGITEFASEIEIAPPSMADSGMKRSFTVPFDPTTALVNDGVSVARSHPAWDAGLGGVFMEETSGEFPYFHVAVMVKCRAGERITCTGKIRRMSYVGDEPPQFATVVVPQGTFLTP